MTTVIPHQGVFVVPEVRVVAVLDPLLLYELKLAGEAGIERHEDHAAIVRVCDRLIFRSERPIGQAATRDTTAIDEPSVKAERVPRMDTSNMAAPIGQRVPGSVTSVGEVGALVRILGAMAGVWLVGSKAQWESRNPPAPDELRGKLLLAAPVAAPDWRSNHARNVARF